MLPSDGKSGPLSVVEGQLAALTSWSTSELVCGAGHTAATIGDGTCGDKRSGCQQDAVSGVKPVEGAANCDVLPLHGVSCAGRIYFTYSWQIVSPQCLLEKIDGRWQC